METLDSCGVSEGEVVRGLIYFLSVGAMNIYETAAANKMNIVAQVYRSVWPVFSDTLIQRCLT